MKRLLALSVIVIGSYQSAFSQAALLVLIFGDDAATENFHFSLDAGLNFSNISNLDGTTNIGANFGLGVFVKLNDQWSFVPEFKPVSRRGERGIEELISTDGGIIDDLASFESKFVLNYIDIPLLLRYELTPTFYAAVGPQVSFRTSAELRTAAVSNDELKDISLNQDFKDQTNGIDVGFAIEAGYHLVDAREGSGIDIKLRWAPGLTNILDTSVLDRDYKINNFQLILSFPFLKKPTE